VRSDEAAWITEVRRRDAGPLFYLIGIAAKVQFEAVAQIRNAMRARMHFDGNSGARSPEDFFRRHETHGATLAEFVEVLTKRRGQTGQQVILGFTRVILLLSVVDNCPRGRLPTLRSSQVQFRRRPGNVQTRADLSARFP